jgi:hypothetical protein
MIPDHHTRRAEQEKGPQVLTRRLSISRYLCRSCVNLFGCRWRECLRGAGGWLIAVVVVVFLFVIFNLDSMQDSNSFSSTTPTTTTETLDQLGLDHGDVGLAGVKKEGREAEMGEKYLSDEFTEFSRKQGKKHQSLLPHNLSKQKEKQQQQQQQSSRKVHKVQSVSQSGCRSVERTWIHAMLCRACRPTRAD